MDKKINAGIDITRNLEALREAYKQKQRSLPFMQKLLPAQAQPNEFLAQILHCAQGQNIDFISIGKPEIAEAKNPGDFLQKLSLKLSLRCGVLSFINYLNKLNGIHRIYDITGMRIWLEEDYFYEARVDFIMETYAAKWE